MAHHKSDSKVLNGTDSPRSPEGQPIGIRPAVIDPAHGRRSKPIFLKAKSLFRDVSHRNRSI
jgi:hypothetical protein